jgi:hypothetical protein
MNGWTIGADIGAMLTGLSVLTATIVWTRNQWEQLQQRRAETQRRNWHGYIGLSGISDWFVQLAEEPQEPDARVVLRVTRRDGTPDTNGADSLRQHVVQDGLLCRVPSPAEYDFLKDLHKKHGYGSGVPVR